MTAAQVSPSLSQRFGDVLCTLSGSVATVVIDRPAKRNALSQPVVDGLSQAIATAIDHDASVLVLRGTGGTLSAGADLALVRSILADTDALRRYVTSLSGVCDALASGPFVSVAVVDGYAVAGGCELLLACDLALAADDARIGDRHLQHALLPGAGGSARLFRRVSPARARRLFFTAEMISGQVAAEWGLVSASAPSGELELALGALLDSLAAKSPAACRAMKQMLIAAENCLLADAIACERELFLDYIRAAPVVAAALDAFLARGPAEGRPAPGEGGAGQQAAGSQGGDR